MKKIFYVIAFFCITLVPIGVNVVVNPQSLKMDIAFDSMLLSSASAKLSGIKDVLEIDPYCKDWVAQIHYRLWNTTIADNTLIGKDDHLFYLHETTTDSIVNQYAISPEQLAQICEVQQRISDILEKKGVHYVIAVAPEKWEVYQEKLPWFMQGYGYADSARAQIVKALQENTDVNLIDFTEALQQEKSKNDVYFVTDSHWNYFGAYRAYQEIITQLQKYFPDIHMLQKNELILTYKDTLGLNLAVLSYLRSVVQEKPVPIYDKDGAWDWRSEEAQADYADPGHPDLYGETIRMMIRENRRNADKPNMMLISDSFAGWHEDNLWDINSFLSESLHRYVRYHYTMYSLRIDLIEEENSDIVMQLYVGSTLAHMLTQPLQGTCHKGQKISFAADAADTSMVFYDGLSNHEEQFTWFDGDTAQAWLFLSDYDGGAVNIDMALAGSYLQTYEHQIMDFTINGQYTERVLVGAADTEISLIVPEEYCDEGDIHMRIDFPNAEYTPGMERKLSVALSSMTLY